MHRLMIAAAALAGLTGCLAAPMARAETAPVVVELFTSQGCSACPPADRFLEELAGRDDVIALGLHVDYWDYIGWADRFAKPAFSDRQRRYALANDSSKVYTPEMVIGGTERVKGNRAMPVMDAIRRARTRSPAVRLSLERDGATLRLSGEPLLTISEPLDVKVVQYTARRTVAIEAGENAGLEVTYTNVVSRLDIVDRWDGRGTLSLVVEVDAESKVAAFVQRAGQGRILGSARPAD